MGKRGEKEEVRVTVADPGGGGGGGTGGTCPPPLPDDSLNIHDVFCVPRAIITARNSAAVSYSADTCAMY